MIEELLKELVQNFSKQREQIIKDELIRFLKEGLIWIEETTPEPYLDGGELKMQGSIRLRVKNDDYILQLEKQLAEAKDHCEKCGCNEFLCGHNRKE